MNYPHQIPKTIRLIPIYSLTLTIHETTSHWKRQSDQQTKTVICHQRVASATPPHTMHNVVKPGRRTALPGTDQNNRACQSHISYVAQTMCPAWRLRRKRFIALFVWLSLSLCRHCLNERLALSAVVFVNLLVVVVVVVTDGHCLSHYEEEAQHSVSRRNRNLAHRVQLTLRRPPLVFRWPSGRRDLELHFFFTIAHCRKGNGWPYHKRDRSRRRHVENQSGKALGLFPPTCGRCISHAHEKVKDNDQTTYTAI